MDLIAFLLDHAGISTSAKGYYNSDLRSSRRADQGLVSLYQGVFNILKIMTTTHNDIVCISSNSKSAHSNPPIYIHMQKEDSLSFPTVLGSGGRVLSLLNKICIGTKWLRL